MPIKDLDLSKIITDAGTDVRSEINEETVTEYGEAARNKAKFPPLVVFETDEGLLLADGFHRFFGFERQGIKKCSCDIRKGSRADALKFALGCNTTHGLRRTNADKRNALEIAFKEFADLSDRQIGEICAIHHSTVAAFRAERFPPVKDKPLPPRKGKDGKSYPARPAKQEAQEESQEQEPETLADEKPRIQQHTMDATGIDVPEEVIAVWDSAIAESQRLMNMVSETRTRLKVAQERKSIDRIFAECNLTDMIAKLDQVYADLKLAKPYAVCPDCNGTCGYRQEGPSVTCPTCKTRGFVSQFFWEHCVPQEKKKVSGRE